MLVVSAVHPVPVQSPELALSVSARASTYLSVARSIPTKANSSLSLLHLHRAFLAQHPPDTGKPERPQCSRDPVRCTAIEPIQHIPLQTASASPHALLPVPGVALYRAVSSATRDRATAFLLAASPFHAPAAHAAKAYTTGHRPANRLC